MSVVSVVVYIDIKIHLRIYGSYFFFTETRNVANALKENIRRGDIKIKNLRDIFFNPVIFSLPTIQFFPL